MVFPMRLREFSGDDTCRLNITQQLLHKFSWSCKSVDISEPFNEVDLDRSSIERTFEVQNMGLDPR
jgi:hypothetical protein